MGIYIEMAHILLIVIQFDYIELHMHAPIPYSENLVYKRSPDLSVTSKFSS